MRGRRKKNLRRGILDEENNVKVVWDALWAAFINHDQAVSKKKSLSTTELTRVVSLNDVLLILIIHLKLISRLWSIIFSN